MKVRKPIQLVMDPKGRLIALCDDGSIWAKENVWTEIIEIPQDDKSVCDYCDGAGCLDVWLPRSD
jgi:hypothetical protein